MVHQEKISHAIEELMHMTGAKMVSTTPCMVSLSAAIVARRGTAMLMFRNEAHKKCWHAKLMAWLQVELTTNTQNPMFTSRAEIIHQLNWEMDAPLGDIVDTDTARRK